MFKQITNLAGGEYYLIASLLIFMVFFLMVGIYLVKMNKPHIVEMSNMPFNDDNQIQENEEG
jgi:hypothetical protein